MPGPGRLTPPASYPGVYVHEVDASALTVPPQPTALTAFVGRARKGPVDTPVSVTNAGEFARIFGGLWQGSELSYAVYDFFDNGGAECRIVRLFVDTPTADALGIRSLVGGLSAPPAGAHPSGVATIGIGPPPALSSGAPSDPVPDPLPAYSGTPSLTLDCASPGAWGNHVTARVDRAGITEAEASALGPGLSAADFFDLYLQFTPSDPAEVGVEETWRMVTLAEDGGPRRLDRVLADSDLARWTWNAKEAERPTDWIAQWQSDAAAMAADPTRRPLTANPRGVGGFDGYHLQSTECYTSPAKKAGSGGLYALDAVQVFNLLVIPRDQPTQDNVLAYADVFAYVVERRAFWILDSPIDPASSFDAAILDGSPPADGLIATAFANPGTNGRNAAVYFPDVQVPDPVQGDRARSRGPCGMIAGIYARTDASQGIWRAPAGQHASLVGVDGLALHSSTDRGGVPVSLTDDQCGTATVVGINCLMSFPILGPVVWGARTLRGADSLADMYKYVPVRRLALWIEQEVQAASRWAVFQPNDETLWAGLRQQIGGFLAGLWQEGAFVGSRAADAYFVNCDATTTTTTDQANGIVNIIVGFAPVRPAEFIILYIEQMTQTA